MEILRNTMFSKIYEVDCFQKEFKELAKEKLSLSPPFPRYQRWLISSLMNLEEYGMEALKLKNFEKLENVKPNLYSIRYPQSRLNPRVLYVYLAEGEILLLAAFKEKNESDYNRNIKLAKQRLKLLDI